jgi:thermostable 8-oxoguanine DNA glycosylase
MTQFLIDPHDVTKYDRTDSELQLFLLFCQTVAGKTAEVQAKALERFFLYGVGNTPFEILQNMIDTQTLTTRLQESKLGQYTRLTKGFTQCLTLDLRTCTVDDLKAIQGIGNKTARYFLLHSRKDQRVAVLDVHILKYLRSKGFDAPKQTPNDKKYLVLEKEFLKLADNSGMTVADFDLMLWSAHNRGSM